MVRIMIVLLMASPLLAMQQQAQIQESKQEQTQPKKEKQKQSTKGVDQGSTAAQERTEALRATLSQLMNEVKNVDDAVKNFMNKEHKRICPICHLPSTECPTDQEDIKNGRPKPCGCSFCRHVGSS